MSNLNSDSKFFKGKKRKVYEYFTHHNMPRINYKKRKKPEYQGIVKIMPDDPDAIQLKIKLIE